MRFSSDFAIALGFYQWRRISSKSIGVILPPACNGMAVVPGLTLFYHVLAPFRASGKINDSRTYV